MWRHAGGEQGGGGQQATATGDGVDESGNKGNGGENGEGGQIYAKFERHGMDLIGWAQKGLRPKADMVMEIKAVCQGMLRSTG
jgi:hypothetical protein